MQKYQIEQQNRAVSTVKFFIPNDWQQSILLMSDNHHDSVYCNREFERKHLEEAKKKNALVCIFGDFFDAMQGRFDPRRNMDELREEYRRSDYYDFVVTDAANFLKPYAKNLLLIARGNHESAVNKNANIDLTDRLVFLLNLDKKSEVLSGGYGGWLRFLFRRDSKSGSKPPVASINMKYFHGAGGEAPVTKGAIQTNRQAVFLPDADIVVNGHNHQNYIITNTRERLSLKSHVYFDNQYFVRIPGYKQSYADGTGGWDVETGKAPKPIGAVWLHLRYKNKEMRMSFEADVRGPDAVEPAAVGAPEYEPFPEDSEYP